MRLYDISLCRVSPFTAFPLGPSWQNEIFLMKFRYELFLAIIFHRFPALAVNICIWLSFNMKLNVNFSFFSSGINVVCCTACKTFRFSFLKHGGRTEALNTEPRYRAKQRKCWKMLNFCLMIILKNNWTFAVEEWVSYRSPSAPAHKQHFQIRKQWNEKTIVKRERYFPFASENRCSNDNIFILISHSKIWKQSKSCADSCWSTFFGIKLSSSNTQFNSEC